MARKIRLKADYILPILSHPIPNGVITIRDNIIEDISPYASFPGNKLDCHVLRRNVGVLAMTSLRAKRSNLKQQDTIDLGRSVLMPGFVNCHTHLELGMLKGALKYNGNFAQWLDDLVESNNPSMLFQTVIS